MSGEHELLTGNALHEAFHYVDSSDPGAVGAGMYWLDISSDPYVLKRRNAGDTDWVTVGATGGGGVPGEGHITILPWNYNASSGTWAFASSGTPAGASIFNGYFNNSSAADGDYLEFKVYLDAGTYTLRTVSPKNTDGGKVDFQIDTVVQGTVNLYNGTLVWNQITTITGIVVASAGLKTLKMVLNGKDGSAYNGYMNSIGMWRTA